jgi:Uma2 family endonuclease
MGHRKANLRDSFVPDASYTAKESIPAGWNVQEPFPGVPTLAVEIASPSDNSEDFALKIAKYLELGTAEVWAVYPRARQLNQHRRDTPDSIRSYHNPTERIETPLLPGLELTMADVFAMPNWT